VPKDRRWEGCVKERKWLRRWQVGIADGQRQATKREEKKEEKDRDQDCLIRHSSHCSNITGRFAQRPGTNNKTLPKGKGVVFWVRLLCMDKEPGHQVA
jgi:hypothetical protein